MGGRREPLKCSAGSGIDARTLHEKGGLAQVVERPICMKGFLAGVRRLFFSLPNWRNGSAPAYGAGGCGFEPHVGLFLFVRYGVVGNMSGSHPVASGSIPGIGSVGLLRSLSSVGRASA